MTTEPKKPTDPADFAGWYAWNNRPNAYNELQQFGISQAEAAVRSSKKAAGPQSTQIKAIYTSKSGARK